MDNLFLGDKKNWQFNACINWSGHNTSAKWDLYAEGYREAAESLIEHLKKDRSCLDTLIFPLLFCYRHFLELRLKEVIIKGRELHDIPETLAFDHDLDKLWNECKTILIRTWPSGTKSDLDNIELCINSFHQIDRQSFAFRYPANKKGEQNLSGIQHIGILNLSECMSEVSELLDGASCGIHDFLSRKYTAETDKSH